MTKSKDELFKISKAEIDGGCTKYFLYKYIGWWNFFVEGSKYHLIGDYGSFAEAMTQLNSLYANYYNSKHHGKEVKVWPLNDKGD